MSPQPSSSVRLERLPPWAWGVMAIVLLSAVYSILQVGYVRPYLWPAGTGALYDGTAARLLPVSRPPDLTTAHTAPITIQEVARGSPAAEAGLAAGDLILAQRRAGHPSGVDFPDRPTAVHERLATWRALYWMGVSGPIEWDLRSGGDPPRTVLLSRPPAWRTAGDGWAPRHLGPIAQVIVFTGAAIVLLLLRSHDLTAGLCVLALALIAVAGGGLLLGAEAAIPLVGRLLTVFAWIATPLAFPAIALAILYFPTRSPLLGRYPLVHAVPVIAAAPMIVPAFGTALYLTGVDAAAGIAAWDASHPGVYHASIAVALGINVLAVGEGTYRYRFNHHADERRRIRMALYAAVPGVLAYAIKDGVPIAASVAGAPPPVYPGAALGMLQALVLLPAFGLVYAIGVARVPGPRVVLRRSLQYALASRTLTVIAALPAIALVLSLVRDSNRTIPQIATGRSGLYLLLLIASAAAFAYRERARRWLDQRFFREEYDARGILLSLASRVRFETDPADLADMVVDQVDAALHPTTMAILVNGLEKGALAPVIVLHGASEPLPADGALTTMLRWSDDPLEIFPSDPRSPAHRLPPAEREWLERTGTVLLMPVLAADRTLVAVIALGERRSEEAYTAEDRQLLASIAAQMKLGFDVTRLRPRGGGRRPVESDVTRAVPAISPMMECPRCGRCEDAEVRSCRADGSALVPGSVPRTIENTYRIEQLIGRGGMGAVYRARDMRLDRQVALKVVRAELLSESEARRRFRREAQIIARLQHPSIVSVFDFGTLPDGGAYLVMELVRGEDLRRVLQREGRLEPARALPILLAVCAAIEAAHREGVLHRDLKPENILLPDGGGEPKVLDFGVANVVADEGDEPTLGPADATVLTAAGMIIGTPAYMAPEQFRVVQPDGRTDVFSLGVIAYEMLSGELPFGRGSLAEVVLAQARGVAPLGDDRIPAAAERAIRMALDPDPDRRPASPRALAHLLAASFRMT